MAKHAPKDEKPFRPLDFSVLKAVVQHTAQPKLPPSEPRPTPGSVELSDSKPQTVLPLALTSRLDQEKRILFTREESHALDRLAHNLAVRLNAQVKVSHVIRALTTLLLHAEARVDQRAGERGALTRPSNSDFTALQHFERDIAGVFASALRDAGAL